MVPVTLSFMFIISVMYIDVVSTSVHEQILHEEEQSAILLDEIINDLSKKGPYIFMFKKKSVNEIMIYLSTYTDSVSNINDEVMQELSQTQTEP